MAIWDGIFPRLTGCLALTEALPDLPKRALYHAGPAFRDLKDMPVPVQHAAIAAILAEGWANEPKAARALLLSGGIALSPAQNIGLVTPLACVVSPSMPVLRVEAGTATAFAPINDGPLAGALRFGQSDPAAQVARIAQMQALAAPLNAALHDGIAMLPLMAKALAQGDDLHGSVAAMTALLATRLGLNGDAGDYSATPLFALNPVMAAAAAMLRAAAANNPVPMVIAAGGNGLEFGWKSSENPTHWHIRSALPPVGPRMIDGPEILPAIGDSAVIDALGLGGPALRYAPDLVKALAPFHPASTFPPRDAFFAPHPDLPADLRLGLPASQTSAHPGIMLAMLGAQGEGLIGRGLAPWPD